MCSTLLLSVSTFSLVWDSIYLEVSLKCSEKILWFSVAEIPWIVTRWHHPVTTNETNKTFECNATGIPKPNITWYYTTNNTAVDSENRKLLEIKNEDCRNVTLEYYCMAVNDAGKAKTNLTVKGIYFLSFQIFYG